jgi:hypothetical protein
LGDRDEQTAQLSGPFLLPAAGAVLAVASIMLRLALKEGDSSRVPSLRGAVQVDPTPGQNASTDEVIDLIDNNAVLHNSSL